MALRFRYKSPLKSGFINVGTDCTVADLYKLLAKELDRPEEFLQCKLTIDSTFKVSLVSFGYPPRAISVSNASISSLGIQNNETITVSIISEKIQPASKNGQMLIREMPDDNSCLFSSIAYVLRPVIQPAGQKMSSYETAQMLRQIAAAHIVEHPERFTTAVLGRPRPAYIEWIQEPNSWGGAIELAIFADIYGCEIGSIDVQSGRIDVFGNGIFFASILLALGQNSGYIDRVYLLYSGIHYDALAWNQDDGKKEYDRTIFPTTSSSMLQEALNLASIARQVCSFEES